MRKFTINNAIWRASKVRFFWIGALVILSVIPKFVSIYGLKLITDSLIQNKSIKDIACLITILVFFEVINYVLKGVYENYFVPKSNLKISKYINTKIFNKIQNIDAVCYDDKEYYEKLTLAIGDADSIATNYCDNLLNFLSNIVGFIFTVLFIIYIDWVVVFIPVIALSLLLILNLIQSKLFYHYNNDKKKSERFLEYLKRNLFDPYFAYELMISPLKKIFNRSLENVYSEMQKTEKKYDGKLAFLNIINNTVFSIFGFGIVMFIIAYRVTINNISVGDFVGLANASLSFVGGFMSIVATFPNLVKNKLTSKNISDVLNYESTIISSDKDFRFDKNDFEITFKNVNFAYPFDKTRYILRNINFSIQMGQKVAIVGCNGAGKSTLIKLLIRMYDVTSGSITIGDSDIKEYGKDELHKNISVLLQNFKFMPVSIAENILMRPAKTVEDEQQVWEALTLSGLDEKVRSLKNNIYTILSKEFDKSGVQLSGGELQKLCLARVFAQKAKIIILDEPSSSLDAVSENYIFSSIYSKLTDRTVIFITHRLNATYYADKIILIKEGEIVEQGTHDALMSMRGEYEKMFSLQSSRQKLDPQENMNI